MSTKKGSQKLGVRGMYLCVLYINNYSSLF